MAESRFTQAGVYVEIGGVLARVTQMGGYVEIHAVKGHVTAIGLYVEIVRAQARATLAGLYVEIGQPRRPTMRYEYDGYNLTDYCNFGGMEIAPAPLQRRSLADVATVWRGGLAANQVQLKGDWHPELDARLGGDAFAKRWRTATFEFEDGLRRIKYRWDERVQVANYQVTTRATGKIEFSATLRHNGPGVRTTNVI